MKLKNKMEDNMFNLFTILAEAEGLREGLHDLGAAIGAGIAVFTGVGSGIGQGLTAGLAAQGVSRQPEAASEIRSTMIMGQAVAETANIYGLIVAILLIFVF